MARRRPRWTWAAVFIAGVLVVSASVSTAAAAAAAEEEEKKLLVDMTLVPDAASAGAVCLDGSPPAYHLDRGAGSGAGWLLQFEGGGWCNDARSCAERAGTRRGSTRLMNKLEVFSGVLSDDPAKNPDFYNWNRVKLRYCDGGSFAGDSEFINGTSIIYMRGQRIWDAIITDLFRKGLATAQQVLLSGCSAGGLATFFHCDDLQERLGGATTVKCMSDAGFFLDVDDISGDNTIRPFFSSLVDLQGAQKNLNKECLNSMLYPYQCFFPQYALQNIRTPYFILNSAYDVYQFHHTFVPPSCDPRGQWSRCKSDPAACSTSQIATLQGLRNAMLTALNLFEGDSKVGMFINSCFAHCQSELQDTWFAPNSPSLHNKG
ncbi:pectin acetylesterase 9 isoform X4 [Brachypodium distachyon]|uniref:Pectin acetylesterase n=1 Tax=Brachypodium distachyon TaxID=15368 RepID=A0A0Q3HW85_BRADI|nr:pectin acetylesterase 9 isoform X4 [Brachypodium distachyon]KQJ97730.1 hypothetical protein BRADI_3g32865v3 [Brachypodium distachyon]|eukprot:XP_024316167.1 pectin acetylesterase 9 isoform X4 [Brachypodium distachyon]